MKGWIELHDHNDYSRPLMVRAAEVGAVKQAAPNREAIIYSPTFPLGKMVRETPAEVLELLDAEAEG